jgi:hypothetical protein
MNQITAEEARSLRENDTLCEIYDQIRKDAKERDCTFYYVKCHQVKSIKSELEQKGFRVSVEEVQTEYDGLMSELYIVWDE